MELDGTRRQILKLQPGELQRRKDGGLYHYCGLAGHVLRNCPSNRNPRHHVRFLEVQPEESKKDFPPQS